MAGSPNAVPAACATATNGSAQTPKTKIKANKIAGAINWSPVDLVLIPSAGACHQMRWKARMVYISVKMLASPMRNSGHMPWASMPLVNSSALLTNPLVGGIPARARLPRKKSTPAAGNGRPTPVTTANAADFTDARQATQEEIMHLAIT